MCGLAWHKMETVQPEISPLLFHTVVLLFKTKYLFLTYAVILPKTRKTICSSFIIQPNINRPRFFVYQEPVLLMNIIINNLNYRLINMISTMSNWINFLLRELQTHQLRAKVLWSLSITSHCGRWNSSKGKQTPTTLTASVVDGFSENPLTVFKQKMPRYFFTRFPTQIWWGGHRYMWISSQNKSVEAAEKNGVLMKKGKNVGLP